MIHVGDCLSILPTLPAQSVQTCITSPPYFGLRDYGTAQWEGGDPTCQHEGSARYYTEKTAAVSSADAFSSPGPANAERLRKGRWRERGECTKCGAVHTDKQIGMEATPEEFIAAMVAVFREVRRVLRDDGTLWLNLGCSYASSNTNPSQSPERKRDPSCGIDGKEFPDSFVPDRVCRDCGGVLQGGFSPHRGHSVDNAQQIAQAEPPLVMKGHDTEHSDCVSEVQQTSSPAVLPSTILSSPSNALGASGHEDRASIFRGENQKVSSDAPLSECSSACTCGIDSRSGASTRRTSDNSFLGSALPYSTTAFRPYKSGELMDLPHRVAEALSLDGWFWRSTIIWHKRSPMPESIQGTRWVKCRVKAEEGNTVRHPDIGSQGSRKAGTHFLNEGNTAKWADCPGCSKCSPNGGYVLRRGKWRPTTGHEYVFLFSKSERYFCDGDGAAEPVAEVSRSGSGNKQKRWGQNHTTERANGTGDVERQSSIPWAPSETRNPRSVWTLSSEPYKAAHFATFPAELVWRCIKPATSPAGCCPACGSALAPVVEKQRVPTRPGTTAIPVGDSGANRDPERHIAVNKITGYRQTCSCNAGPAVPCLVLDPFAGSGTVGQVAEHTGRAFVGCELNAEYVKLAEERIATPWQPKETRTTKPKRRARPAERMLFQ